MCINSFLSWFVLLCMLWICRFLFVSCLKMWLRFWLCGRLILIELWLLWWVLKFLSCGILVNLLMGLSMKVLMVSLVSRFCVFWLRSSCFWLMMLMCLYRDLVFLR